MIEERRDLDMPESEAAAANEALANSKQIRRLRIGDADRNSSRRKAVEAADIRRSTSSPSMR